MANADVPGSAARQDWTSGDDALRIANTFYHPPKGSQSERYKEINEVMKHFMIVVARNCPPSRQKSLAMTKMEEARMWANAAIACNE